jgi:feruloyl esterase
VTIRSSLALAVGCALLPAARTAAEPPTGPAAAACADLATARLPGAEVSTAQAVAAGTFTAPDGQRLSVPAFCRVHGVARPTAASAIAFEVWLPTPKAWTGRYVQQGNGGFAGNLSYATLADEVRRGNAAAVTDTGHSADAFDASWAVRQPQKVVDYGYRAIKATSDAARALADAFYGRPAQRRYFVGCSNGGRQALMAAELYPADWDGVIAGAPAVRWTEQLTTFARIQHRLRSDPAAWIPAAKLPAIQRAALKACEGRTPVVAGVPRDPSACPLPPARLVCHGAERDDCLTPAQAGTLALIEAAGYQPSSAAAAEGWDHWILNPDREAKTQLTFATQAFRSFAGFGPAWRVEDFDPARDPQRLAAADVAGRPLRDVLDPDNLRLAAFARRGGKMIGYIGWADPVLSPTVGLGDYRQLRARLGAQRTADFYRVFMVPGMGHCQGGPGPDGFGQAIPAPAAAADPAHDIRLALEAWVERGAAPAALTAVKYRDGDPAKGVVAETRLCPYPQTSCPAAVRPPRAGPLPPG